MLLPNLFLAANEIADGHKKKKNHSSASFHCAVNSIVESKIKTSSQTKGPRDASPKWVGVITLPPVLFSFSHTYLTSAESKLDV